MFYQPIESSNKIYLGGSGPVGPVQFMWFTSRFNDKPHGPVEPVG
jgi:hypothetical protein